MKSLANWSLLAALITVLLLGPNSAYAQKLTGTISGTVTDASGAAVPGALVTVTNTATSQTFNATTDTHGNYTVAELPDSVYDVKISATNFKEFRAQRAIVHVATTTTVDAAVATWKRKRDDHGTGECAASADRQRRTRCDRRWNPSEGTSTERP